jgi:hypothetical protein
MDAMKIATILLLAISVLISGLIGLADPAAAQRKRVYGYAPYAYVPYGYGYVGPANLWHIQQTASPLFPIAMDMGPMRAAPSASCRAAMAFMAMGRTQIAPRAMVLISVPIPGGERWVGLAWTEDRNNSATSLSDQLP